MTMNRVDETMEEESLNAQEMSRLATWLEAKGHTAQEVLDCLKYIAGETASLDNGKEKD